MSIRKAIVCAGLILTALTRLSIAEAASNGNDIACQAGDALATAIAEKGSYVENQLEYVGLNHADNDQPWVDSSKIARLQQLNPAVLRYPGGAISSYWDYRNDRVLSTRRSSVDGWIDPDRIDSNFISTLLDENGDGNALEYFTVAYNAANFAPLFVVNMVSPGADYYAQAWARKIDSHPGTSDTKDDWWLMLEDRADRALDMLERANALGLPIQLVELGNEYYFLQDYTREVIINGTKPSAQIYAQAANYFAARIKERFPDTQIAAIASDAKSTSSSLRKTWIQKILPLLDRSNIDAVTLHLYFNTPVEKLTKYRDFQRMLSGWVTAWKDQYRNGRLDLLRTNGWDVWVTETLVNIYPLQDRNTWAASLANSYGMYRMASQPNFKMIALHQFNLTFESESYLETNLGPVASAWSRVTRGATEKAELSFRVTQPGARQFILGSAYKTANGEESYILTNLQPVPVTLDVTSLGLKGSECTAHYSESLAGSAYPISRREKVSANTIVIPALSIVTLAP